MNKVLKRFLTASCGDAAANKPDVLLSNFLYIITSETEAIKGRPICILP